MYKRQYRWRVLFEWDEIKNQINIRKHGIDFQDAIDVFNHPLLTALDQREDYGEDRWFAMGWIANIVGVVVYVERVEDVRSGSFRHARPRGMRSSTTSSVSGIDGHCGSQA
ncbi:BrnT family toxin [Paraburkholderia sp. BL17N1]|uniref:BrnT family toxin n=1 Tax=Paraburkholderia sp. BL17N1 TaxID=1938798 RepID=UPI000F1560E4|nr:BrnT family toxin [Paraburkholderia sp. BL17N1]RKR43859.1 hypothetical protein B0G82_1438 [Paraburkholderia sp. BL17N1]